MKNNSSINFIIKLLIKNWHILLIVFIISVFQISKNYKAINNNHTPYKLTLMLLPNENDIFFEIQLLSKTLWEIYVNIAGMLTVENIDNEILSENDKRYLTSKYSINIEGETVSFNNNDVYENFKTIYFVDKKQIKNYIVKAISKANIENEFNAIKVGVDQISKNVSISSVQLTLTMIGSDPDLLKLKLENFLNTLNNEFKVEVLNKLNYFFNWTEYDIAKRIELINLGTSFDESTRIRISKSISYYKNLLKKNMLEINNIIEIEDKFKNAGFTKINRTYQLQRARITMLVTYVFIALFSSIILVFLKEMFYALFFEKKK